MALSRWERKGRLQTGDVKEVADELRAADMKISAGEVSLILHDKCSHMKAEKVHRVRVALARKMRPRVSVAEAFGLEEERLSA